MSGKSVLELLRESQSSSTKLSFGSAGLDSVIGDIPYNGITEISGEAGSGKTQLCLSMALKSIVNVEQKKITGSVAILSCGEGMFPIKRLSQFAQSYQLKTEIPVKSILSNIRIMQCMNPDHATDTLLKVFPSMCSKEMNESSPYRLLIIDSLAGLIRFEYDTTNNDDMKQRTTFIFNLAKQLKWLSDTFHLGVIVVNQMTAGNIDTAMGSGSIPALGLAWSTCVNTRFVIKKTTRQFVRSMEYDENDKENTENMIASSSNKSTLKRKFDESSASTGIEPPDTFVSTKRTLILSSCSYKPFTTCDFAIRTDGIIS